MASLWNQIKTLSAKLYPTGRAFYSNPIREKLHNGLAVSEKKAYLDAFSILDSILPDNVNFTEQDATDWEVRLGLITNPLVSLDDRKLAIIRKMNHPGDILARQSADYLQRSLQLAGFNVYVYENPLQETIEEFLSSNPQTSQFGNNQWGNFQWGNVYSLYPDFFSTIQWGNSQWGNFQWGQQFFNQVIANSIDESKDKFFDFGLNPRRTFFIGGATAGSFADVDINRKEEFRQIILRIKPVQKVGYLLINFI